MMKVAIGSVQVPFTTGGAEILAVNLRNELIKRGFEADILTFPFKWYPASAIVDHILMSQMIDLSEINQEKIDLFIGLKFPMYYAQHPNKVLWMLHQHRQAYDLWGSPFGDLEHFEDGQQVKELITDLDRKCINESKKVFGISQTVIDRLKQYNGLVGQTLYHPPADYEKLHCAEAEDFIFYPSRISRIKRQDILIEALALTRSKVNIVFAGSGESEYMDSLKRLVAKYDLGQRVRFLGRISDQEKVEMYSKALAVYNGPYGEDYGYVTLEAYFSGKPVVTFTDSGGPLEFVRDGENGFVVEPSAQELAEKMDYLFNNKTAAKQMGESGRKLMSDLKINWDHVIERLTS